MRLRHIPGCEDYIAGCKDCINSPDQLRGRWNELFGVKAPLNLEVGMGKGRFLRNMAVQKPEYNYLGLERYESVLYKALLRKHSMEKEGYSFENLYYLCADATKLTEIFAPGEVSRIYLNFSDPWPKQRHSNRRLTSPFFLKLYDQILSPDGCIEFKTDNRQLFEWSVSSINESRWSVTYITYDLHSQPFDNIMTEYESKFSQKGQKICKLIAMRDRK